MYSQGKSKSLSRQRLGDRDSTLSSAPLYPLRFKPIFKAAIWGGRRLAEMFPHAPAEGPIGEAWLLSDHGDEVSVIADGRLAGTTLRELMRDRREELLGPSLAHYDTFPLLLKIIDARENLSVQVHPDDALAQSLAKVPRGKTEAWVVLHAEPGSRIYAGLKPGVDQSRLEQAIANGTVVDCLHSFEPTVGDCVYLPAGTVHALGAGITIFEVQQTSDTTYRLHDWNRIDAKTGRPRQLHVEEAITCVNFDSRPIMPVRGKQPTDGDVKFMQCDYFDIWWTSEPPGECFERTERARVLLCLAGETTLRRGTTGTHFQPFDVVLVPPGKTIHTSREAVTLLDIWPL
jgi:mannose-6-phosphate isomerase